MADTRELTLTDKKKLEEELNDQNTAVAKAKTELSRCQSEYQKTGNKVEDWKTKLNNAEAQVIKANSAVAENARYMDEAAASADKCAKSIDAYGKAVKEPEKINTESLLKGAVIEKAVDIATNGLGQIAGAAKEAVTEIKKVGSSFEAAMSGVEGVSGATKQEVSQLSDKAKEIGANTKLSAEQAAGAMMNLSVAGWQVQETLDGVDGVVYLARAANMDLAESAQIAADNIATFNLQASDTTHIADMLAYAQAHSNTTASQLGQAYKNSAANMNAAGQTIETTTAILEALANNGLRSAESGTALAAVMRDMTSKMEDGAIAIGDTSVKVMDSRGNFRDMLDILKDVEKATNGMGDAQKQAALLSTFTSDSIKALNMMLNTGADEIAGYREELENCAGAAEEMGDTMDDNLEGATAAFNSAVESLEITIYEKFSGPLKAATEMATSAVSSITKAITPQKDAVNEVYDSIIESTEKLKDNVKSIGETFTGSMEEAQNVSDLAERFGRVFDLPADSAVMRCWDEIYRAALNNEMGSFYTASGYAYQFMMQLYNTLIEQTKTQSMSDVVQRCMALIQTEYKNELDLAYLSKACNVSIPYLSKRFQEALHISPIQYLNQHRIEVASSLLLRSRNRIEEIAHEVGFSDANYFARVFKKTMGCTPRDYRLQEVRRVVEDHTLQVQVSPEGIIG